MSPQILSGILRRDLEDTPDSNFGVLALGVYDTENRAESGADADYDGGSYNFTSRRDHDYTEEDLLANAFYLFVVLVFTTIVVAVVLFGLREYTLSMKNRPGSATDLKVASAGWSPDVKKEDEEENGVNDVKEDSGDAKEDSGDAKVKESVDLQTSNPSELHEISSPSAPITGDEYSPPQNIPDYNTKNQYFQSHKGTILQDSKPTGTGLVQEPEVGRYDNLIDTSSYRQNYFSSSLDESAGIDILKDRSNAAKIEIIHDTNSPSLSEGTFSKFFERDFTLTLKTPVHSDGKIVYNMSDLYKLNLLCNRLVLFHQRTRRSVTPIILSEVLRYSIKLPCVKLNSVWEADKLIAQLRSTIMNGSASVGDRHMAAFQIACIGASYDVLDNENYYLYSFNELIENIIDTAAVFELLNDIQGVCQGVIIEMILIYCWSHWNFRLNHPTIQQRIDDKFSEWDLQGASLQNHQVIFRLLCNFKLGMQTLNGVNGDEVVLRELQFRLQLLFRECIKTSYCDEYVGFIPMLAQAVDISMKPSVKYFFYDLLKIVLVTHAKCCMREYLQERSNTNLKALIQHGLWYKHDERLKGKVREIYTYLVEEFGGGGGEERPGKSREDQVMIGQLIRWIEDIDGGKKYVLASARVVAESGTVGSGVTNTLSVNNNNNSYGNNNDHNYSFNHSYKKRHEQRQENISYNHDPNGTETNTKNGAKNSRNTKRAEARDYVSSSPNESRPITPGSWRFSH